MTKAGFDLISISIICGTLMEYLPTIAALISVVWGLIRIYETKTVQKKIRGYKRRR